MFRRIKGGFVPGLVAATLLGWGCDRPATPASPKPSYETGGSGSCSAGEKFTGGGRIDPSLGKTTFGFNVQAEDWCRSGGQIKGKLQTVYHSTHTLIHSLTIDQFFSFESGQPGGRCAAFGGTARVKDGHGSWVQRRYAAIACDNGEPGSRPGRGPDSYEISLEHRDDTGLDDTGLTDLTGGNIQAH